MPFALLNTLSKSGGAAMPDGDHTARYSHAGALTRRAFVVQGAACSGAVWLLASCDRVRPSQEQRKVLTANEWNMVSAITGCIIPTDHEPGAIEANCVGFIDGALANEEAQLRPLYQVGLRQLDAVCRDRFNRPFLKLASTEQDRVLSALESEQLRAWGSPDITPLAFFATVRTHTIIGFLADPKYGGNRSYAGWQVVGYPGPRHRSGGYLPAQMLSASKIRAIWGDEI